MSEVIKTSNEQVDNLEWAFSQISKFMEEHGLATLKNDRLGYMMVLFGETDAYVEEIENE